LTAKGVEIIKADIDDMNSLLPAFEGANVIFSNTDFFGHFFSAIKSNDPSSARTPNEIAYELEVAQGVNIAEAAASPAVLKTLERFVLSSLCDARKWSGGKYTNVYHFDSKAEMIRVIQTQLPELAARMSTVLIGHYVTNWKAFPAMAPKKQPDGSFLMTRPVPIEQEYPFIVAHRDTGPFVKTLVDMPPGQDVLAASQSMTWPEWIKIWGNVLGVKARYERVSGDDFLNGLPEPMKIEFLDTYNFVEEFGFTGGDPAVLMPEQVSLAVQVDILLY
jgi:hypothetical protein